jgi:hypothetical protein
MKGTRSSGLTPGGMFLHPSPLKTVGAPAAKGSTQFVKNWFRRFTGSFHASARRAAGYCEMHLRPPRRILWPYLEHEASDTQMQAKSET